jgi:hypothetical protein
MKVLNNNLFMKKILFLLTIGLFVAGSVSAQTYYYGPRRVHRRPPPRQQQNQDDFYRVKVGLTGGLNLANTVNAYGYNSTGTIAAWNAGIYFDVPLAYPLSFEPEVLYSQKGFTAQLAQSGTNFTSRADYIDVPLLAKFNVVPGFNFLIGPQISFLTQTTNTYADGTQDHYNYGTTNALLDGVIGVSFDLNRSVELRARYTIDMSSNNDADGYDYRNQVWQIGLGFTFQ